MNVTELARILKVNPKELREKLPKLGFDIGQKAIKIDNRTAQTIIKKWAQLLKELEKQKSPEDAGLEEALKEEKQKKTSISIPKLITVREFAAQAQIPVNKVLSELMKNGIFASMNERIDYETAEVIGSYLGIQVKMKNDAGRNKDESDVQKLENILKEEDEKKMKNRPPIIVVMGHVDHGKTKLLDTIRKTNIVGEEAGGITQHIGAYQVERKKKLITFIDTPGHEAFTAMRNRGAKIADVAILVVAADDGVKPQTIEAYKIIEAAKIPFVVAINKIDKADADIEKTKQELSNQLKIIPEDWGGKTICVPISAKKNIGIENLLDMILLVSEMEEEKIKANPDAKAIGTVIESHIDKAAGPVATLLIQNGTLKIGENLCWGEKFFGKVRALKDYNGKSVKTAPPSMPVKIIGLKICPEVGDILEASKGKKIKYKKFKLQRQTGRDNITAPEESPNVKKLNIIIKSDVLGSAEAIEESLEKISTDEIKVNIVYKGLGNITESDLQKADTENTEILGFNVKVDPNIENLIREKNIKINVFNIIYDLIKYVKNKMESLLEPETKRIDLGKLKVLAVFKNNPGEQIVGGKIIEGKAEAEAKIEIMRGKEAIARCNLIKLQSGKQDVSFAESGQECGVQCDCRELIKEGDLLQFYKEEKISKKL